MTPCPETKQIINDIHDLRYSSGYRQAKINSINKINMELNKIPSLNPYNDYYAGLKRGLEKALTLIEMS